MEAASAQCKVISTRVGLADDLLDPSCIYASPIAAVSLIEQDITDNRLAGTVPAHYARVRAFIVPERRPLIRRSVQESVGETGAAKAASKRRRHPRPDRCPHRPSSNARAVWRRDRLRVGLWHSLFAPPYGGGNQFMLGLRSAEARGSRWWRTNSGKTWTYLLNSIHFDVEQLLAFAQRHRFRAVHRIDGPIHLIRGFDREKDELCFELNKRFAAATVLQSTWTYQRITEMSYQPVKPVIIRNAVDPSVFHPHGRVPFDPSRKIRLIATSWSNNARKGGPIYKWLEERLDWNRFDFTFVGNASVPFTRIRTIPAVPSEKLAKILREHDIYITASQNDPLFERRDRSTGLRAAGLVSQ